MNKFQEKIDLLSDSELLEIARSKDNFQEQFWLLAIENAKTRGLETKIEDIVSEIRQKENDLIEKKEKEANLIDLYSDATIVIFSIIFSTLAGAILFYSNLKRIHQKGGDTVLAFGFIYTFAILALPSLLPFKTSRSAGYLLNIVGGLVITVYFGNKYYPENLESRNKKPWKAFLIALAISIPAGILYVSFLY